MKCFAIVAVLACLGSSVNAQQTPNPSVVIGCNDITDIGCPSPLATVTKNPEKGCENIIACPSPISAVTGSTARLGGCIYEDPKECKRIASVSAVTGVIYSEDSPQPKTVTGNTDQKDQPALDPAVIYFVIQQQAAQAEKARAANSLDHNAQEHIVLPAPPSANHAVGNAPVSHPHGK